MIRGLLGVHIMGLISTPHVKGTGSLRAFKWQNSSTPLVLVLDGSIAHRWAGIELLDSCQLHMGYR